MAKKGQVITFYSYKGGVGRSMALANVAVLLSQWGFRVLAIDWDLEAPGLSSYFGRYRQKKSSKGLIDILSLIYHGSPLSAVLSDTDDFYSEINVEGAKHPIDYLDCGCVDDQYYAKVRDLDIATLYQDRNGGEKLEALREKWIEKYHFVLIDSRTGITDSAGICTVHMPDMIIGLHTANYQSVDGLVEVAQKSRKSRRKLPIDRPTFLIVPIASRFETQEEVSLAREWVEIFTEKFFEFYADWSPKNVNVKDIIETTKLPHVPYFTFGEKIAVLEQGTNDPTSLGYAYENLASLIANGSSSVSRLLDDRDNYILYPTRSLVRQERPAIFIFYSHLDEEARSFVQRHLGVMQQLGDIRIWNDSEIGIGDDWFEEIEASLDRCTVAVLLVSQDFLGSEFCMRVEVPVLLERRKREGMMIVPILLRHCAWQILPWLRVMQMHPRQAVPLLTMDQHEQEKELTDVVLEIHEFLSTQRTLVEKAKAVEASGQNITIRLKDDHNVIRGGMAAKADSIWPAIDPARINLTRLPVSGYDVVGRDYELRMLDEAFRGSKLNILSLRAWGGVGKSALVNTHKSESKSTFLSILLLSLCMIGHEARRTQV